MHNPKEETYEEDIAQSREVIHEDKRRLRPEPRLGLPFALRLPLATTVSILTGAALGIGYGSKLAALRFRAENSHRLPTTPVGWYLYHKSKNYYTALGGVKEGAKMGSRVGIWTAAFFTAENILDTWRGQKDFFNTVGGGLSVAGGFCLWNSLPLHTAARTLKIALLVGLAYGLAQDTLRLAKEKQMGDLNFFSRTSREAENSKYNGQSA